MRLGGMVPQGWTTADEWAQAARGMGYGAVIFPLEATQPVREIDAFVEAAAQHDLVIAEVGVWNNVLASDPAERQSARERAVRQLELADYVGARCCVNIAGSFSEQWDGPHPENLTERGFEAIVEVTQWIIDQVNPKRSEYSLEPMPWMYPDSPESFLALIEAVDRRGFGVHLDPVNTITSLHAYYHNGAEIQHWFDVLGDRIVSCHAKDIILRPELTLHLDECRPGTGYLDYETYLRCLASLKDPDVCVMFEHMTEIEDYKLAVEYVRKLAHSLGIEVWGTMEATS